jgi:hypothetical protein
MSIRRPTIIISAILATGVALAALAGSEISAAAQHAPSTHVGVTVVNTSPNVMFHG